MLVLCWQLVHSAATRILHYATEFVTGSWKALSFYTLRKQLNISRESRQVIHNKIEQQNQFQVRVCNLCYLHRMNPFGNCAPTNSATVSPIQPSTTPPEEEEDILPAVDSEQPTTLAIVEPWPYALCIDTLSVQTPSFLLEVDFEKEPHDYLQYRETSSFYIFSVNNLVGFPVMYCALSTFQSLRSPSNVSNVIFAVNPFRFILPISTFIRANAMDFLFPSTSNESLCPRFYYSEPKPLNIIVVTSPHTPYSYLNYLCRILIEGSSSYECTICFLWLLFASGLWDPSALTTSRCFHLFALQRIYMPSHPN